ncbi:serine hydrolase domain-containing protein [Umezawaea sp. Da 62-37]|uniref:serine hydrolase domain-containing protein n=1 Tax=Umezawaea sp. Da 62-37 TaxID=3075927 RepID=UPI0028F72CA5|nr:serine hydrolase domain-containing protein [Umezawaea sp. Da 62-37]WNV82192.1 serine hydrolase domain-containing protein [Umezawaea sp. Da 62-37]
MTAVSHREHRPARRSARRRALSIASAVVVGGLAAAVVALPSSADPASARDATQRSLNALVRDNGFPGALATVRERDGRVRDYTAGVGDLKTKSPVPVNGQVRIASNTKAFVATVVLQLVGEGKVRLDVPVETYLPNIVRGEGIDGRVITVRQLLQHTSGLADYDEIVSDGYAAIQHRYFEPREMVDLGLAKPAVFAPGGGWSYSNTNYVLAGLLVQKVTGRPIGEEITRRVIDRVGLRHTYWPAQGDQSIREAHPRGYFGLPGEPLADVTEMDPSLGWAAGQLISTPRDLEEFFRALVGGGLLGPAELEEMRKTVDAPGASVRGGERYGLGLQTFTLSCGGVAWTHGGDSPGYETRSALVAGGRSVVVAVTSLPTTLEAATRVEGFVDGVMCG